MPPSPCPQHHPDPTASPTHLACQKAPCPAFQASSSCLASCPSLASPCLHQRHSRVASTLCAWQGGRSFETPKSPKPHAAAEQAAKSQHATATATGASLMASNASTSINRHNQSETSTESRVLRMPPAQPRQTARQASSGPLTHHARWHHARDHHAGEHACSQHAARRCHHIAAAEFVSPPTAPAPPAAAPAAIVPSAARCTAAAVVGCSAAGAWLVALLLVRHSARPPVDVAPAGCVKGLSHVSHA